eukprot:CAMPEP_0174374096 /NCGR_PEP_ID=MMETSP0811_2-20130205/109643_1 /TAXON_ID=73025 ORGANISM="Eutreptiella gymnastica-like, Strain CCMP1594" /NCGR_SAMPLE_ID=MMETSP0811_2 /ASSEMBLY_ACC=CAM_ASM_000667 /LENGTH=79 /DNA_ID=CAMNT_0015523113 /DNA_START=136 /DNA_END=375 /DNA_ORIENTATION=+
MAYVATGSETWGIQLKARTSSNAPLTKEAVGRWPRTNSQMDEDRSAAWQQKRCDSAMYQHGKTNAEVNYVSNSYAANAF